MTARFLQEDTFAGQREDPLSLNLYTYCHNSPLLYSDPTGHWPEWLDKAGDWVADKASDAWEATKDFAGDVVETASAAWDKTKEVAGQVADKAADLWTAATNTATQYIEKAKEAAKTVIDTTGKIINSAVDAVKDAAKKINDKVIQPIKNTVVKAAKDVKEKVTEVVESGKQWVFDTVQATKETEVGKFLYNLGESTVNVFNDAYTYLTETPVDQMMYELGESTVSLLKDFGEDMYNYDPNNQDSTKVQNSNLFSCYKGKFVFFYPGEILGYDTGGGFSLGIIGMSEDVKNDYSKDFIPGKSYFQAVLEHEWGHTQQLAEMGLKEYVRDIAIPSFTYAALDSSRPYGTYHGSPFEYGADEYAGNVWPNPIWPGTDPLAGQWYDTYMRADTEQRKYYRDNPEQLKQDSAAFNTRSSYSLDEYDYQKRQSGA